MESEQVVETVNDEIQDFEMIDQDVRDNIEKNPTETYKKLYWSAISKYQKQVLELVEAESKVIHLKKQCELEESHKEVWKGQVEQEYRSTVVLKRQYENKIRRLTLENNNLLKKWLTAQSEANMVREKLLKSREEMINPSPKTSRLMTELSQCRFENSQLTTALEASEKEAKKKGEEIRRLTDQLESSDAWMDILLKISETEGQLAEQKTEYFGELEKNKKLATENKTLREEKDVLKLQLATCERKLQAVNRPQEHGIDWDAPSPRSTVTSPAFSEEEDL